MLSGTHEQGGLPPWDLGSVFSVQEFVVEVWSLGMRDLGCVGGVREGDCQVSLVTPGRVTTSVLFWL